jgi:hypothetical protein
LIFSFKYLISTLKYSESLLKYNTNLHVGQTGERNVAAGYVQKVLTLKFGTLLPQGIVTATHMLGHYTSTRYLLSQAGIPNILPTESRASDITYELKFADDARLRFGSAPAGTHRLAVCYEAAKRLAKYQYAYYCPGLTEFNVIPQWRSIILENPTRGKRSGPTHRAQLPTQLPPTSITAPLSATTIWFQWPARKATLPANRTTLGR